MELKDFVNSTLIEILEGLAKARSSSPERSGIGRSGRSKIENVPAGFMQDHNGALYTVVEFDVAVTATTKADGSAGIDVWSLKIGGAAGHENQTVSRVRFAIPMKFDH